ncbi:MAG: 3-deoxy-D-manno-octulosonic acid transferase [bacterium]|nr:3-deoxy-D-manno-octulosonic acid transferase [bacterium]MDD5354328.1 3-deoxy-D-manno-octulosonic acid transferase [bacterium]MDD5756358.1 3-deoxy-D-manno-octulosonic acid transferase [bacterium]
MGYDLPVQRQPVIWLHAASIGEVKIAAALVKKIRQLNEPKPIVVSIITPAGFRQAKTILSGQAEVIFAPLDLPFIVSRTVARINPALLGIIETELWPNLITAAWQKKVKIILLNGRLSDRSYPTYQRFKILFKKIISCFNYACVQTEEDKEKFTALGFPSELLAVSSSVKYDFEIKLDTPAASLRQRYSFTPEDLIWVAGSTRNGEEIILIEAWQAIREKVPNLKLILAPRHLHRLKEIKKLLAGQARPFALSSQVHTGTSSFDCLVVDTMGELLPAYSIADVVFVGGSLVKYGGQNILEPAALAKPVVCGQDMRNFKEITSYLLAQKAIIQVHNPAELVENIVFLLTHTEAARQMGIRAQQSLMAKKGAVDKNVEAIERLLAR